MLRIKVDDVILHVVEFTISDGLVLQFGGVLHKYYLRHNVLFW